jgi:hypothetical protein
MDADEKRFWHRLDLWGNLWITILSIGILGVLDGKYIPGGILALAGLIGVIYVSQREKNAEGTMRYVAMAMLVLTWVFVGYDIYGHWTTKGLSGPLTPEYLNEQLAPNWGSHKYQDVYNHPYSHETVYLDGHRYLGCTFDSVTFVYQGTAPFTFLPYPPKLAGANKVQTNVQIVGQSFNAESLLGCVGATLEFRNDVMP